MKISSTMNLDQLAERMGDATQGEAAVMRDLLADRYDGKDTADVPESEWLAMLNEAAAH